VKTKLSSSLQADSVDKPVHFTQGTCTSSPTTAKQYDD